MTTISITTNKRTTNDAAVIHTDADSSFTDDRSRTVRSATRGKETPVIFYQGDRIYFRPVELEDEPLLRRFINNPDVWSTLGHRGPVNACREREWIESLGSSDTDYVFGIVVKENNLLIGTTGLHRIRAINRSAEFGIGIGDVQYQNRSYGTEAIHLCLRYGFEELNLNRIALSVFSHNWRAIRVYQRVGFVHEGCLRQAVYRHGQYHDEYRFAILRSEWETVNEPASEVGPRRPTAGARLPNFANDPA